MIAHEKPLFKYVQLKKDDNFANYMNYVENEMTYSWRARAGSPLVLPLSLPFIRSGIDRE
jgi:hypothetical protein